MAAAAPLTDVIYIAPDSDADGTRDRAEMDSRALQQCLQLMQAALAGKAAPDRFWIVTRGGQGSGITNLSHALLWGFGRSVSLEHPEMRTIRVDLDPLREPEAEQVLRLARSAAIEDELVLRDGSVMVPRLRRSHAKQNGDPAASAQSNMQLAMTHAGSIDGLHLLPETTR